MKALRFLLILAAFLVMISSTISLFSGGSRWAVYVNVGAMATLVAAVTVLNFKAPRERRM